MLADTNFNPLMVNSDKPQENLKILRHIFFGWYWVCSIVRHTDKTARYTCVWVGITKQALQTPTGSTLLGQAWGCKLFGGGKILQLS